jgi:hypothetical protein
MSSKQTTLDIVLAGLMTQYSNRVPDVSKIISAMINKNIINSQTDIINDHIAFRTFAHPYLGIRSLEKIFSYYGYKKRDFYEFKTKKLNAYWFSPPKESINLPRLFISECKLTELSKPTQEIINSYLKTLTSDPVDKLDLNNGHDVDSFLHTSLWHQPTWEDYQAVLAESEYAAWVLYNRYYLNHFTITIHKLTQNYNTIKKFNSFLESIGIKLNHAGGKVKISADKKLHQSSTVAQSVPTLFTHKNGSQKTHTIAGSYVEFAERIDNRDGFEVGNADKIFESTYTSQL